MGLFGALELTTGIVTGKAEAHFHIPKTIK